MMQETLCRRRCLLKIPKNYTGFTAKTNVFAEHSRLRLEARAPELLTVASEAAGAPP
jgi:hypothetical protein